MSKQFLIDFFQHNQNNVMQKIKNSVLHGKKGEHFEYVTIVPKCGRDSHLKFLIENFKKRKSESESSHRMIVVEHAENPSSVSMCLENDVDHLFIPKKNELFNKCLSMNVGSFLHSSKYIHFHDVDLWMPPLFWKKIQKNLNTRLVVQAFTRRRVNYIDEAHSVAILNKKFDISNIVSKRSAWQPGKPGAPGGSLVIDRNLFNSIGGFDPYYFLAYSIEDQFFVDKIETKTRFFSCDTPPIEMFHLWHPSNEIATPLDVRQKGLKTRDYFIKLSLTEKDELIKLYNNSLNDQRNAFNEVIK